MLSSVGFPKPKIASATPNRWRSGITPRSRAADDTIVFVHDDVLLIDFHWLDKLAWGFNNSTCWASLATSGVRHASRTGAGSMTS
jgi:hypothetical protein